MKGNGDRLLRAVRRGVGLAVCAVLVWMAAVTADPAAVETVLTGGEERTAVALLAGQTRVPPAETQEGALELLLRRSPLLAQGRGTILSGGREGEEQGHGQPVEEHDDDMDQPKLQPPASQDGILELTAKGKEGSQYLSRDGLYLYDRSKLELTPAVLDEGKVDFTLGEGPRVTYSTTPTAARPTPRATARPIPRATPTAPPTAPTTWSGWGRRWPGSSAAMAFR